MRETRITTALARSQDGLVAALLADRADRVRRRVYTATRLYCRGHELRAFDVRPVFFYATVAFYLLAEFLVAILPVSSLALFTAVPNLTRAASFGIIV